MHKDHAYISATRYAPAHGPSGMLPIRTKKKQPTLGRVETTQILTTHTHTHPLRKVHTPGRDGYSMYVLDAMYTIVQRGEGGNLLSILGRHANSMSQAPVSRKARIRSPFLPLRVGNRNRKRGWRKLGARGRQLGREREREKRSWLGFDRIRRQIH